MKILANDGISESGAKALQTANFELITTKVAQEQLENFIQQEQIDVLLVRSATTVRQALIDACPSLKVIGRGGVGMDNIDVEYARSKGLHVINTPAASSASVAELVFAHLYGSVRFLHQANRDMPLDGDSKFKTLKKAYAKGTELRGKTLGVIGLGRIGCEVAKIALGVGMKVIASDTYIEKANIKLDFFDGQHINFEIKSQPLSELFKQADFITLHLPAQKEYVIGKDEIQAMKKGVGIINAARGGVIDEVALVEALDNEKVAFAALDVFEEEPKPAIKVLMNPKISLSPHIGAATQEAQDRIGLELAAQVINILK